MEAAVRRGHLEYRDERGSYRIPVGRRSRKCLAILDKREGEYVRSLEIDLFTGFVYYCVDNATSGGLSYYYDMSSKKVGHYFIHRYIRNAINHGFTASPLELEIFEKLPCKNWPEEMGRLPGWKEAIERRVEDLLLPGREILHIRVNGAEKDSPAEDVRSGSIAEVQKKTGSEEAEINVKIGEITDAGKSGSAEPKIRLVSFLVYPAAYPAGIREHVYLFDRQSPDDRAALLYRNKNLGNEFFGGDGEYELFLTAREESLIGKIAEGLLGNSPAELGTCTGESSSNGNSTAEISAREALRDLRKEHDSDQMVLKSMTVSFTDGTERKYEAKSPEEDESVEDFRTILHGLLRREVILV